MRVLPPWPCRPSHSPDEVLSEAREHGPLRSHLRRDEPVAAVDGDLVAALHEAFAELLRKSLEAAIVGRNPSGPKDSDAHGVMVTGRESAACGAFADGVR